MAVIQTLFRRHDLTSTHGLLEVLKGISDTMKLKIKLLLRL